MVANNGSATVADQGREIGWAITSQTNSGLRNVAHFYLQPLGAGNCELNNYALPADTYTVVVEVTGAAGLTDTVTFTITAS